MDALPTEGFLAGGASQAERETIADYIVGLEQLNPTENPAQETLDGTWDVVWSGGLSPALLAAQALLRVPDELHDGLHDGDAVLRHQPLRRHEEPAHGQDDAAYHA